MLAMFIFLIDKGFKFTASPQEAYKFIIGISTGSIAFGQIVQWLKENTSKVQ